MFYVWRDLRREGANRRAECRGHAIAQAFLWLLKEPGLSYDDLLARVRRCWRVSCSGVAFAADLRRLFDLTPEEREERLDEIIARASETPPIRPRIDARGYVDWASYPRDPAG